MNKEDLWLLFKNTGKIEYYLKYINYGKKGIHQEYSSLNHKA